MNFVDRYIDVTSKVNEATVRMLAGNKIVLMCAVYGLTFRVEDKVFAQEVDDKDGRVLVNSMTPRSTTDYICFSVHHNLNLTAVLLRITILMLLPS